MSDAVRVTLSDEAQTVLGVDSRLQDVVEEAGRVLRRPVAIDDRHLRLLAYTEHPAEDVDEVRLASVLKQRFVPELLDWLHLYGLGKETGPLTIPGNPELGLRSRVCFPIRCHNHLLGYLWLIGEEESIDAADHARAEGFAQEAGIVLYRDMLLRDLDRSRERECLRDVVSSDAQVREHAVKQLAELDLFTSDGPSAVIVTRLPQETPEVSMEAVRLTYDSVIMRVRRTLAPRHALHLMRPDHVLVLVSLADPRLRTHGIQAFADDLRQRLTAELGGRCLVAIGETVDQLVDVAASYRHAVRALEVADAISTFGDVVSWQELGIYRMLADLTLDASYALDLPAGLQALIENPRKHDLVRTLECYLDHAGDIQATAAALYLHRTTLWHRLRRFEELAGCDLSRGDDRLILHLSLKLARLRGLSWREEAG
jgi:sugar diacid utilization regulator